MIAFLSDERAADCPRSVIRSPPPSGQLVLEGAVAYSLGAICIRVYDVLDGRL